MFMMIGRELKRIKGLYQLWETVSEGSPITPFFTFKEDLITWLLENDTSITKTMTREDWNDFFDNNFGLINIQTQRFTLK